ncbi:MAG: arylsulfatase, partial [Verrucomicrobiota bacterium]
MKSILSVAITALCLSAASAEERPNVIVFLTDDQGWGDSSFNGNTNLSTPHIDSLAEDGAHFERFYVAPVCSPTRAEFLTGRYHTRSGVFSTSAGGERIDLDEVTIGDVFQKAGYATGAFGKWHNGMQYPYHPNGRGFGEFYGFCSGHWGNYYSPMMERNGEPVQGEGFCVDDFTDKTMDFIEANKDKPFFAYVPYNTPHSPMQVPDEYWDKFKDKELEMKNREPEKEVSLHLRCALAMCENIDWNVGRVLAKLDELKIAENTIVIYFCDNGPNGVRWNGDMLGRKGSTDEGGVRSIMHVRWPAQIDPGTVIKQNGGAIDLMPTLMECAGISTDGLANPLDGISLKSILNGDKSDMVEERILLSYWNDKVAARKGGFVYGERPKSKTNDTVVKTMHNLRKDPGQHENVLGKMPKKEKALAAAVAQFRSEIPADLRDDKRPFVVAHPDHPMTQL